MIFSVERAALLEAVSKLQRIVGAKTSMPILEGILISAEQGKITLVAYNLEAGMKKELYARCEEPGDIVLSAQTFANILRGMNGLQVDIRADERLNCNIKSGEATFDIMGMAAADFPEIPSAPNANTVSIEAKAFAEMGKRTVFAAAQNEGLKPILTGVNVLIEDGVLQLVGIDGYRLAIRREKVNLTEQMEFTIPSKALSEAIRLIGENTETVEIRVGDRLISFSADGYEFISRLLEGDFVNYRKTIPEGYSQRTVINTRELTSIIERVSLLISESFSTPVRCYFNELNAVFTCATTKGRATETFDTKLEGEAFEIGLNSKYLLDALRAIDAETVQILFNGPNNGVLMLPLEGDEFLYMVMPMRMK